MNNRLFSMLVADNYDEEVRRERQAEIVEA